MMNEIISKSIHFVGGVTLLLAVIVLITPFTLSDGIATHQGQELVKVPEPKTQRNLHGGLDLVDLKIVESINTKIRIETKDSKIYYTELRRLAIDLSKPVEVKFLRLYPKIICSIPMDLKRVSMWSLEPLVYSESCAYVRIEVS